MNKIIAIVGMCGSGKSIASEFFINKQFKNVYFGGVTLDELKKANLEDTPENEKMMRNKLRKEYGMGAFAYLLLPKIEEYAKISNVVLDGLYSWAEYKTLKEKFGQNLIVLAIVEDKEKRYERLEIRKNRPLTKEQAKDRDISEIEKIEKGGPISYADYFILNNGTIEDYKKDLEEFYKTIIEGE